MAEVVYFMCILPQFKYMFVKTAYAHFPTPFGCEELEGPCILLFYNAAVICYIL